MVYEVASTDNLEASLALESEFITVHDVVFQRCFRNESGFDLASFERTLSTDLEAGLNMDLMCGAGELFITERASEPSLLNCSHEWSANI
jgi:hypothetical protein